jgi:hypothetical protein
MDQTLRASRDRAFELDFPPFVGPERGSTPLNATPYLAHISDVQEDGFLSNRVGFIDKLAVGLEQLRAIGATPVAALLGGSAIGPKPDPSDLDCAIFYEVKPGTNPAAQFGALQARFKQSGIDARLMPMDGDPLLLMKAVSFFTTLYCKNAGSLQIVRGLVLLDCRSYPR